MSDIIPQVPQKLARKTRSKRANQDITFTAPTAAADPQSELEAQAALIEENKRTLGLNVALTLNEASQRGFVTGLTEGLKAGAAAEASFFSNCIASAGASLL
jgi:flagellar biosynthesis/type III secretory pathway protein FliH